MGLDSRAAGRHARTTTKRTLSTPLAICAMPRSLATLRPIGQSRVSKAPGFLLRGIRFPYDAKAVARQQIVHLGLLSRRIDALPRARRMQRLDQQLRQSFTSSRWVNVPPAELGLLEVCCVGDAGSGEDTAAIAGKRPLDRCRTDQAAVVIERDQGQSAIDKTGQAGGIHFACFLDKSDEAVALQHAQVSGCGRPDDHRQPLFPRSFRYPAAILAATARPRPKPRTARRYALPAAVLTGAAVAGLAIGAMSTRSQSQATGRTDSSAYSDTVTKCRVVDGDTLHCDGGRIRLLGIDAPELPGHCAEGHDCAAGDPYKSTRNLGDGMGDGASLTIARVGTDRYGRTLAPVRGRGGDLSCWQLAHSEAIYKPRWDDGGRVASMCPQAAR